MIHASIAMISSSSLLHINWAGMLANVASFSVHVLEVHGVIVL